MSKAVYAGSFDVLTNGHLWMIEQGSKLFDELLVLVAQNAGKQAVFDCDERVAILNRSLDIENVTIETVPSKYTAEIAKEKGIHYILRGIRSETDYQYENMMRHINNDMNPDLVPIFLMPPKELSEVSSSVVKGFIGFDGWVEQARRYAPIGTIDGLISKFGRASYSNLDKLLDFRGASEANRLNIVKEVMNKYQEKHRHYHSLYHINHCLEEFDKLPSDLHIHRESLELAIWFHDIIYDPMSKGNEKKSADLAEKYLFILQKAYDIDVVVRHIMTTVHDGNVELEENEYIVDIDLTMLANPKSIKRNNEAVRKEYIEVPYEIYVTERIKILEGFLKQRHIYYSQYFRDKYEYITQTNIKNLISELKNDKSATE